MMLTIPDVFVVIQILYPLQFGARDQDCVLEANIATPKQKQEAKQASLDPREHPAANHYQTVLGPDHRNDWTRQKYKWGECIHPPDLLTYPKTTCLS